jgi:hypothetical protein
MRNKFKYKEITSNWIFFIAISTLAEPVGFEIHIVPSW